MGNHIFLVGKENFAKCLEYGIYGGIDTHAEKTKSQVIAGFEGIRPGDFLFFHVNNVGIYGLWKATCAPFFDEKRDVWGRPDQLYPYRVCFEPSIRHFPRPIASSDIMDMRDQGKIWSFDLGTVGKKSHHPITTEEGKELIRLLLRNNPISYPVQPITTPLTALENPLPVSLETDAGGQIRFEGYLNAWFMRAFARGELKSIIGEYQDFLNLVPTSFNTVMDLFLTHVTKVDGVDVLHKFTCIELKTGVCTEENLNQIIRYEHWLVRKLAGGDDEMVQSILVGFDFQDKVLEYVAKRKQIEEKTVKLLRYRVTPDHQELKITEAGYEDQETVAHAA